MTGADPVELRLADSFNRPGGNLTGVSNFLTSLGPKQLELLHELLPSSSTIASLVSPSNPNLRIDAPEIQAAADALGQHLKVLAASTESDLETAFTIMVQERVDALVVKPDPFFVGRHERIAALAARHAMPAVLFIPDVC